MLSRSPLFVVDANVLIDYAEADPTMLALMAQHVGPIHVPRRILQEVRGWTDSDCESHGLFVVTEEFDELTQATPTIAGLSFPDRLVMVIAQRRRWGVITNDGRLRRELAIRSINMRWGLEMMLDLVHAGHLSAAQATGVAERIVTNNPRIKSDILVEFRNKAQGGQIPRRPRSR